MDETAARIAAKELQLERSHEDPVHFHGYSMWPFLKEGDLLVVQAVAFDAIRIGDVLAYRREEFFPTHRVVARTDTELELAPDNWPHMLRSVKPVQVLGRVVSRQREKTTLESSALSWRLWALFRTNALFRRGRYRLTPLVRRLSGYDAP